MNELRLAAYLDRRVGSADRAAIEQHLAACDDCRSDVVHVSSALSARSRRRRLASAGALLAVAASVAIILRINGAPAAGAGPDTTLRAGAESPDVVAYGPLGAVARGDVRFVWAPVGEVASYRLTVTHTDGTPVWTTSTTDTVVALPDSVRLTAGTGYFWFTDALLTAGGVRSTGPHEFQQAP